jgi:DNA repair protein RadC
VALLSQDCDSAFESLAAPDLIALVLGQPGALAGERAARLLEAGALVELSRAHPRELEQELGLGPRPARRLAAAFSLGRHLARSRRPQRPSMRSAARVHALLGDDLRGLEQETFLVCLLDGKHALRRTAVVSVGTLTTSLVHPREVFRPAVRGAAAAIVCAHNHPSGDPEPSPEDLQITRRLVRAGKLMGIPVLDHVVIGDTRYVSLRERMGF